MKYPCITFSQRNNSEAPRFCMFSASVKDVRSWTVIPRLTPDNAAGIQREKNDFKVKSIKNFLLGDNRNTIPTALVITLGQGAYSISDPDTTHQELIIIPEKKESIFVVDGQHRLFGIDAFDSSAQVPIVAILEASNDERAFQFVVINNKVSKVSPDHIRSLALKYSGGGDRQDLEDRLRNARLSLSKNLGYVGLANEDIESPFKGLISLPETPLGNRWIIPAAIESSIAYIQSKAFRQLDEQDSHFEFFCSIWTKVKSSWPEAFTKDSKLLTKVGIQCLTRYITDAIDYMVGFSDEEFDFLNQDDVESAAGRVLRFQTEEFWLSEWESAIADTKAVRDDIDESLRTIQQNIRHKAHWANGVVLLKNRNIATQ